MSDLKNRERYTNSLDTKLLNELKQLSKDTKIPVSKLLDESIELLLTKHKK